MKNILIIGGSYFTGRIFVEELLKDCKKYSIYTLNRGTKPLNISGVIELKCDRHNKNGLLDCLPEMHWDSIVDFCAYDPDDIKTIFSVLPPSGFDNYIFISTTSVYADSDQLPTTESHSIVTGPQPHLGRFADYGYNKYQAECVLKNLCASQNIPYTIFRPAIIYGKFNYVNREKYFFDLITENKEVIIPSDSLALFSMIYVQDIAEILVLAVNNKKLLNKTINLSGHELISYTGFIRTLRQITGKTITVRKLPLREIISQKIPLPFPIDQHLIYSGNAILKEMKFQYTSFADGMEETYKFYNKSGER